MSDSQSYGDIAKDFSVGVVEGAIEIPWNGATQLIERTTNDVGLGVNLPQFNLEHDEEPSTAHGVGVAVGSVVPLYAVNKVVGKAFGRTMAQEKTAEALATGMLKSEIKVAAAQGLITGGAYGFVFHPTDENGSFYSDRFKNAAISAAAFSTFNVGSAIGRNALSKAGIMSTAHASEFLLKELPANIGIGTASGAVAGAVSANVAAGLREGRLATAHELMVSTRDNAIFGGAFTTLHQLQSRITKAAPLTEQQKEKITWAKRTDGQNGDWEPIYDDLFPAAEAQNKDVLKLNFTTEITPGTPPDRPAIGHPRMTIHESYAPNGKVIAASINEVFPGRAEVPGERSFILGAFSFVPEQLQSTGIGAHHLGKGVIPELKAEFTERGFAGRLTEIESTEGMPANSQPVRRARFYRDKIGMQSIDKEQFPFELPLYQPDAAVEQGVYVPQRQIPEYLRQQGEFDIDGPVPAEALWTSFDGKGVSGKDAIGIFERLARWGYGVQSHDGYLKERAAQMNSATDNNLLKPIEINPVEAEYTQAQQIANAIRDSRITKGAAASIQGSGFAAGLDRGDDQ